ncbi:hypothetical protein PFISCL1PPCAC_18637, partial [Pristionchus fissidentatus]
APVGIDLGTTFSAIGFLENGKLTIIHNNAGNEITPSVVHYGPGMIMVGEEAVRKLATDKSSTVYGIKRFMGRPHDDAHIKKRVWPFEVVRGREGRASVRIAGDTYSPEEVSGAILKYLKNTGDRVNGVPTEAVITVPAKFTNVQRTATKDAGELAGFKVLQVINEPTAAALAFCRAFPAAKKRKILVYDLGGGTFDVTIVETDGKHTTVLSTDGLPNLGGIDIIASTKRQWQDLWKREWKCRNGTGR